MSQLDLSIFYSHFFNLLLTFYILSHFVILILSRYYYNNKLRNIESEYFPIKSENVSNINIISKILE